MLTIYAPSVKTLTSSLKDIDRPKAELIRKIIKAPNRENLLELACELDEHKREVHWQRYNYINHQTSELRAELLDTVLGTFGVEYMFKGSEGLRSDPESQYDSPVCIYLNAGDPYTTTLIRYHGRWKVGCWGDIAERYL